MAGGPAATDGRLAKGDRLIEINGVNLDGLSHHQASVNLYTFLQNVSFPSQGISGFILLELNLL